MSAFMCDRDHIRYIVAAARSRRITGMSSAIRWRHNGINHELQPSDPIEAARVGQMLWDENFASVCGRYPGDKFEELPGPVGETFVYGGHTDYFGVTGPSVDPVQVIKSCHCYSYQSCEHDGWEGSEAHAFIEAVIGYATHALSGYDACEWGAPKPDPRSIPRA